MNPGPGRSNKGYTDEERDWVKTQWLGGQSSTDIADLLAKKFDHRVTGKAIIGLVFRMKLPARPSDGPWREAGWRRRKGHGHTPRKPNKPPQALTKPPAEAPTQIFGVIEEMVPDGFCKFPVSAINAPFQQCGAPAEPHRPYCSYHSGISYVTAKKPMTGASRSDRAFKL